MIRDLMIGGAPVEDMLTLRAASLRDAKHVSVSCLRKRGSRQAHLQASIATARRVEASVPLRLFDSVKIKAFVVALSSLFALSARWGW
jgi:hypothetical protein